MPGKKDNLPLNLDYGETSGTITYANEVIAIIAGAAANEIDGVAGMCSNGLEIFSRNKNITKGVRVELGTEEVAIDIYLTVEYGTPIQTAAGNVQDNVRKAVESMTGLHVVRVDVHVQGVSFEKERQPHEPLKSLDALQKVQEMANSARQTYSNVEFDGEPTPAESHGSSEAEETVAESEEKAEDAQAGE